MTEQEAARIADLKEKLARAYERVSEMQYEAGIYQALYENAVAQLASERDDATMAQMKLASDIESLRDQLATHTDDIRREGK